MSANAACLTCSRMRGMFCRMVRANEYLENERKAQMKVSGWRQKERAAVRNRQRGGPGLMSPLCNGNSVRDVLHHPGKMPGLELLKRF